MMERPSALRRQRRGRGGRRADDFAVWQGWEGRVHDGLRVPYERAAGVRDLHDVVRQQARVRV